jgi:putative aldouronate transport system permease protein
MQEFPPVIKKKRKSLSFLQKARRDKYLYLIFAIPFLYYVIFKYIPIYGILLAFKDYSPAKGVFGSPWAGLKYVKEFVFEVYSWKVVRNTLIINFYTILFGFPAPVILALAINEIRRNRLRRLVQSVTYFPRFISVVVVAAIFTDLLSSGGMVNQAIKALGGQPIMFLMRPEWFRAIYVTSEMWQFTGWNAIIYLAALTAIEPQLYEAAVIDGASRWQQIRYISIPCIMPTVIIILLLTLGRVMVTGFEKILLLYTPATFETADVIGTYVFRRGIDFADFEFATATGLFQSLVGLIFIVTANFFAKKLSETSLW